MPSPLPQQAQTIAELLSRLTSALAMPTAEDPLVDMPLAQWRVCKVLRDGPRPMTAISRELRTSQSAISQTADRLERAGMIERVLEEGDRRVKHLRLTAQGAALMQARRDGRVRRISEALGRLTDEQRAAVCVHLEALVLASESMLETVGEPAA